MELRYRSMKVGVLSWLLLAAVIATPVWVVGAEPIETVREAFRASSKGLTSGIGKGRYRHYDAIPGGDWQLKIDADLETHFEGRKYHVDLTFSRDEVRKLDARRIIYDGEAITDASFTPSAHPTGAHAFMYIPQDAGNGLARCGYRDFPWDVTNLAKNVWDPERLFTNSNAGRIEIKETPEGDLVGSQSLTNTGQVSMRFECPRRFGFNIARMQYFNVGTDYPAHDIKLEWKQSPNGVWYVTSLQDTFETRNENRKPDQRLRAVMIYSTFEPNAKVDPSLFTEKSLRLPAGSPFVDGRPNAKMPTRRTR